MTLYNISFAQFVVGKLRQNLTDYNTTRSSTFGQFIYPDKPKITTLLNNKNNFPRISVETLSQPGSGEIGMGCNEHEQIVSLKITIYTVRDLICTIKNIIDETIPYTGSDIYELLNLPLSDIVSVREGVTTFIKNVDYQVKDNDNDGMRDSIEWLLGDRPVTNFDVTYKRSATGAELVRIIATDINKYLRDNWKNWSDRKFWNYQLTAANPIDFDEHIGISRYEMTVEFHGINIGDEI